jgi:hypothetical protein
MAGDEAPASAGPKKMEGGGKTRLRAASRARTRNLARNARTFGLALRGGERRESVKQAIGKPEDREVLSIIPLLFLYCSSIVPLLVLLFSTYSPVALRWRPPGRHGVATDPVVPLDSAGLVVIQMKPHFPIKV